MAAEKTIIFAAPDATTRKHFVEFLFPKTAAVPRPAALDTAMNEVEAAEEQEEEEEYEDLVGGGEQQGKVEKDIALTEIKSVYVVSADTMKAESAPQNMWMTGGSSKTETTTLGIVFTILETETTALETKTMQERTITGLNLLSEVEKVLL